MSENKDDGFKFGAVVWLLALTCLAVGSVCSADASDKRDARRKEEAAAAMAALRSEIREDLHRIELRIVRVEERR
jgi:hypothetical protein